MVGHPRINLESFLLNLTHKLDNPVNAMKNGGIPESIQNPNYNLPTSTWISCDSDLHCHQRFLESTIPEQKNLEQWVCKKSSSHNHYQKWDLPILPEKRKGR